MWSRLYDLDAPSHMFLWPAPVRSRWRQGSPGFHGFVRYQDAETIEHAASFPVTYWRWSRPGYRSSVWYSSSATLPSQKRDQNSPRPKKTNENCREMASKGQPRFYRLLSKVQISVAIQFVYSFYLVSL